MKNEPVLTLEVHDQETDGNSLVLIRAVNGYVALCLSLEHGSDVEVVMSTTDCINVAEKLLAAIQIASQQS